MIERLILGCARLTGHASAVEAEALVCAALDAGITHVDTAPSYGMGTAEIVVGQALRRFGGPVRVTAKVGSSRPAFPQAASWLRRAKRAFGGCRSDPWQTSEPPPLRMTEVSGHDFSRAAMARSLEISRERLGWIDFLMLHDVTAGEVSTRLLADLAELAGTVGAQPGYASQCQWDADLDREFGSNTAAQCAMAPAWFQGTPPPGATPLFLHSIVKAGAALRLASPEFSTQLDRAARIVGASDGDAGRIAALYVGAARAVPGARLILASTHRTRLMAVLNALACIERLGSAEEVAAALCGT